MPNITITEALAEVKTNLKKIEKKQEFIFSHLAREDQVRDPLEKDGGQQEVISREMQAIHDLLQRNIVLRAAIQEVNLAEVVSIGGRSRTVAEWLIWKRDVAPVFGKWLQDLARRVGQVREQAKQRSVQVVSASASVGGQTGPRDILINVDESALQKAIEDFTQMYGDLDGKLSIFNATTTIVV